MGCYFAKSSAGGGGAGTEFVTTFNLTSAAPVSVAGSQEAGFKFTVGGADISVTDLGFKRATGTFANKTVYIRNAAGTIVASALVNYTSAAIDAFCWASVGTPVVLAASTVYHISTNLGGYNDIWGRGAYTGNTTTGVATINDFTNASQSNADGLFGLVNFKYT